MEFRSREATSEEFRSRQGTVDDVERIVAIWMEGIEGSLGTPPPPGHDYHAYFTQSLQSQDETFRFTVVEDVSSGELQGWLSLSPFRSNPAVKGIMAELSAYVHPGSKSSGVIRFGFQEMLHHADTSPLQYIVAFTLETNEPALRLLKRHGFSVLGAYPTCPKDAEAPPLVYTVRPCAYPEAQG